jgi:Cof subfamily protein (haloacid dehalogenase superfamily)
MAVLEGSRHAFDLIAIDLDGTLVDAHNQLFPGAEQSIQAAQAGGIEVVLVSGRSLQGVLPIRTRLGLQGPLITSGGALVAHAVNGVWIDHRPLPLRYVSTLVRLARAREVALFLEYPDQILCEAQGLKQESETQKFGYTLTVVEDLNRDAASAPIKATMVGEAHQIVDLMRTLVERRLPVNISRTGPYYLDVCRKGVNKGSAVRRLARYLSIPLKRVAAVGDYYNDVEMFKVSGLAVAMGDAPPEVLKAAHLVAPASDQGGAAWAIMQVISRVMNPGEAG